MAMRIRELAAQTGTTTRTLRYYEAQGLLPTGRSANGYRVYDGHHVRLVREIRSLQAVGFSLEDVRPFVDCLLAGQSSTCTSASSRTSTGTSRNCGMCATGFPSGSPASATRRLPCANCCPPARKATSEMRNDEQHGNDQLGHQGHR